MRARFVPFRWQAEADRFLQSRRSHPQSAVRTGAKAAIFTCLFSPVGQTSLSAGSGDFPVSSPILEAMLERAVNPPPPIPALLAADTLKRCAVSDRRPRECAGPKLETSKIKSGASTIFLPLSENK